jgi:hypothetical protein
MLSTAELLAPLSLQCPGLNHFIVIRDPVALVPLYPRLQTQIFPASKISSPRAIGFILD